MVLLVRHQESGENDISAEGETTQSSTPFQRGSERDPQQSASQTTRFSNIDRGEPRKCPNCSKLHHGSSQLGIFCSECEFDKIENNELDLPENPQQSQEREVW